MPATTPGNGAYFELRLMHTPTGGTSSALALHDAYSEVEHGQYNRDESSDSRRE